MSTAPSIAAFWDAIAGSFDDGADHGLRDPRVRNAWAAKLNSWLPSPPRDVIDLGCGTGSLSLLLAERGHRLPSTCRRTWSGAPATSSPRPVSTRTC